MYSILIAHDHKMIRQGFEALLLNLNSYKLKVSHAANDSEINSEMKLNRFDLVLMDIQLKGVNSCKLIKLIFESQPDVKVLVISNFNDHYNRVRMLQAGAHGYVFKDSDFKEVEDAIKIILEGDNYYSKIVGDSKLNLRKPLKINSCNIEKCDLSNREKEVIKLICNGYSSEKIAAKLFLSVKTIEAHRYSIMKKTTVENVVDLIFYALDHGLVDR